jgi:hypothetical protein
VGHVTFQAAGPPIISQQPTNQSAAIGESATFTVAATGNDLTYQWQRNGVNIDGQTAPVLTIDTITPLDNAAKFRAVVSNPNGSVNSAEATLTVIANHAPVATILTPLTGSSFRAGDTINYTGAGADLEEGVLPASAFTWQVDYYTGAVARPFVAPVSGSASGSFVVPTITPYTKSDVFYRIRLTVTDSGGRAHTTSRDVVPLVSTVTLSSNVPGIALTLDGQPHAAPFDYTSVVNFQRDIGAPAPQLLNGVTYEFDGWSDGGAQTRTLFTPDADATLVATFRPVTTAYLSDLPFVSATNGSGPVERDMSNGNNAPGDGHAITLQGAPYPKGLGVHAPSDVRFDLGGNYWRFVSDIGVDDEVNNSGSVVFRVFADGTQIYASPTLSGASDTVSIDLDVTGAQMLRLVVDDAGDGTSFDHADWANARLLKRATPVAVSSPDFHYQTAPHALSVQFSANVAPNLSLADFVLQNLTSGTPVNPAAMMLAYDNATNVATITFPNLPGQVLPDGNFRLTVSAAGVSDVAGNPMIGDFQFNFFQFAGDANHDGLVNLADFNILASNFGKPGRDFTQGDFNYDGAVDLLDFNLLSAHFGLRP